MAGYLNMDVDAHPGVDYVGDVSDLSRFTDGSIDKVFASNILEHFPHVRTLEVLKEWRRVLRVGGTLYLSVPDFARTVTIYRAEGLKDWIQNFICGDQTYKTAFHYAIFDENRLRNLTLMAGFHECSFVESFDFADPKDCSNMISTFDAKPVCLNAVVRK